MSLISASVTSCIAQQANRQHTTIELAENTAPPSVRPKWLSELRQVGEKWENKRRRSFPSCFPLFPLLLLSCDWLKLGHAAIANVADWLTLNDVTSVLSMFQLIAVLVSLPIPSVWHLCLLLMETLPDAIHDDDDVIQSSQFVALC